MKKYLLNKGVRKIFFILLWIAIWQAGSIFIGNELFLPFPLTVLRESLIIISSHEFLVIVFSTIIRAIISFIISIIISLILGCICGFNKIINEFLEPIISIIKSVPTMAFIIIALIWFDKDSAPYLIGIIISFPILFEATYKSIKDIDSSLVFISNVYNVSSLKKIRYLFIPNIMFSLGSVLNSTICLVFKVVVAGEVYGQPKYGIGTQLQLEKMFLNTPSIFGWIIITSLICGLFNLIDKLLRKELYKWKV